MATREITVYVLYIAYAHKINNVFQCVLFAKNFFFLKYNCNNAGMVSDHAFVQIID